MDEDYTDKSSLGSNPLIGMGLGIAGCLLGLIALIVAMSSGDSGPHPETTKRLEEISSAMPEITDRLNILETRLDKLTANSGSSNQQLSQVVNRFNRWVQQTEQTVKNLGEKIKENRQQLNQLTDRLGSGSRRTTSTRGTQGGTTDTNTANGGENSADGLQNGIYVIQPGDTFSRLANRFGTTAGAIQEANPGTDPRRLHVGQEIVIPGR